jgi:hypothetical protein
MSKSTPGIDFRDLRTLDKFAAESAGTFTVPSLRWMRFNAEHNGFADAFLTVGRRVLIHVPRFNTCLEAQRTQQMRVPVPAPSPRRKAGGLR